MSAPHEHSEPGVGKSRELLSFRVAHNEFAFPVHALCEVIELVEIMRVHADAGLAEGIINYRGVVIPVVDTRRALGFEPSRLDPDAHIIVTDVGGDKTGLIVDAVHDVLTVDESLIEQPGTRVPLHRFVSHIAKLDGRLLLILDIEAVLAQQPELGASAPASATGGADSDAEPVRALLRQRALELAKPVDDPGAVRGALITTVCFSMHDSAYAIRAEFAKEIVSPPPITPIPCAPAYVMGAVNIRGAIVPILDLAKFLGLERTAGADPAEARIIVTDVEGVVMGLCVDRVLGVCEVDAGEIVAPMEVLESETVGFIDGEFDHEGRAVCSIDASAILRALEERQGAGRDTAAPPSAGSQTGRKATGA